MLLKEATVFLLLLGLFHCDASEKGEKFKDFPDESLNSLEERDFNFKQKKNFKSSEEWSDDKYRELREKARHEAEKDYKYLEEKNRRRNSYDNDRFIKSKEFGSNNYIDKYNKYGKSFNLNHIDKSYKKNKGNYQEKHFLSADKLQSFKSDVDDYHMKNNEKINKDYKLISKSTSKPNSLISDMDINYIEDKKNIDKDSEWIEASKLNLKKSKENYQNNYQNKNEKYIKRDKKKFYQNLKEINLSGPPKNDTVLMARYIVHSVGMYLTSNIF